MRSALWALHILLAFACPAMAGKNVNGAIIVHVLDNPGFDPPPPCTHPAGELATCEDAIIQSNRDFGVWVWFLAAFPPESSPGVSVVYFGIDHDEVNLDPGVAYRWCGPAGTLEIPDGDWPYSGKGNSVAFGSPIVGDTLFRFYVFKIDNFGQGAPGPYFCSAINPTGGYAAFVDDSNPPILDMITRFGCVRWYEPGYNDCPVADPLGACCDEDGNCTVATYEECAGVLGNCDWVEGMTCDPNPCPACCPKVCCLPDASCILVACDEDCESVGGEILEGAHFCDPNRCDDLAGACCMADGTCRDLPSDLCGFVDGVYQGDGTDCDPNPCVPPWGACCLGDGTCQQVPPFVCDDYGGEYMGDYVPCEPDPCPPTATEKTTWGRIRASYR